MSKDSLLDRVKARDMMKTDVVTVSTSTPLSEVERLLGEHRISGVPVADEAGHLIGVVSMRDLFDYYTQEPDAHVRRRANFGGDEEGEFDGDDFSAGEVENEATVADVMTGEVFGIPAGASLRDVARRMSELGVHRILVEESGRHVGLITTTDMLAVIATA